MSREKIFIYFFVLIISNFTFVKSQEQKLILGADLSYVNEIEDCGGTFTMNGKAADPFKIFKAYGTNLIRVRLWHSPDWTKYSTLSDVEKTIRRAKEAEIDVLLDFHYSDDWADPHKQIIPAAWKDITDLSVLEDSVYSYTFNVLHYLDNKGLLPEYVQIGNETNNEILMSRPYQEGDTINWERNIGLINKGITAVKDGTKKSTCQPKIMLHIAQPENAISWFEGATKNGLGDFDIIGISYYSKWSEYSMNELYEAIRTLHTKFNKDVVVAETAYPWTLENFDSASNILGEEALAENYPATPEGQYKYMVDLTKAVIKGGGIGVIYWEPAWISTPCSTRWGKGSHWENAAFFDPTNQNSPLPAMEFYNYDFQGE